MTHSHLSARRGYRKQHLKAERSNDQPASDPDSRHGYPEEIDDRRSEQQEHNKDAKSIDARHERIAVPPFRIKSSCQ
jgi:hypothetical protein